MTELEERLLAILSIGHEVSMRGGGLALREALQRTRYRELRGRFGAAELRPFLNAESGLCEEWLAYSEDKRTDGGWYLLRSGEIGRIGFPDSRRSFECVEEATAEYILLELDHWDNC